MVCFYTTTDIERRLNRRLLSCHLKRPSKQQVRHPWLWFDFVLGQQDVKKDCQGSLFFVSKPIRPPCLKVQRVVKALILILGMFNPASPYSMYKAGWCECQPRILMQFKSFYFFCSVSIERQYIFINLGHYNFDLIVKLVLKIKSYFFGLTVKVGVVFV
jgi:hypothetical protein